MMKKPLIAEKDRPEAKAKPKKRPLSPENAEYDTVLYSKLRELRKQFADKASVPAYVVFTDATLREIAIQKPRNVDEFLDISGIGKQKAERYSGAFLNLINEYLSGNIV
nr:HRDC domain-containing protein [Clostridia bacterium]